MKSGGRIYEGIDPISGLKKYSSKPINESAADTHPHMAHLLTGSKIHSEGHTQAGAKKVASGLRSQGVYASVFKDNKTGKRLVAVPDK